MSLPFNNKTRTATTTSTPTSTTIYIWAPFTCFNSNFLEFKKKNNWDFLLLRVECGSEKRSTWCFWLCAKRNNAKKFYTNVSACTHHSPLTLCWLSLHHVGFYKIKSCVSFSSAAALSYRAVLLQANDSELQKITHFLMMCVCVCVLHYFEWFPTHTYVTAALLEAK